MRGLSRTPDERQPTVSQFAAELTAGADGVVVEPAPGGDGETGGGLFGGLKSLFKRGR
jgi:hypothetical protein